MTAGSLSTFVVAWEKTEIDDLAAPPPDVLRVGAAWCWHGQAVRLNGPHGPLRLENAKGKEDVHARAARAVSRIVGFAFDKPQRALQRRDPKHDDNNPGLRNGTFTVTDGLRRYKSTIVDLPHRPFPLLVFVGQMPPKDTRLWVIEHDHSTHPDRVLEPSAPSGVICFTPGTFIDTPHGPRRVERLRVGDMALTKDNGKQPITWIGRHHLSGARLYALPHLRPVRFHPGAMGLERSEQTLAVSPDHRLLIKGRAANDLFGTSEVLVAARDLIDDVSVTRDLYLREVTYIHLMFDSHQILRANGVETESFNPVNAELRDLPVEDRHRLWAACPALRENPGRYPAPARRLLTVSEAAVLQHAA